MIDILHINDFLNISNSVAFVNYCNTLTLQSATIICRKEEIWNLQVLPSTLHVSYHTHILILNSRILFYDVWKLRTVNTWLFVRKYVIGLIRRGLTTDDRLIGLNLSPLLHCIFAKPITIYRFTDLGQKNVGFFIDN